MIQTMSGWSIVRHCSALTSSCMSNSLKSMRMNGIGRDDFHVVPHSSPINRRQMLKRFASGFGMLGLAGLFSEDFVTSALAGLASANPLAIHPPQFPARAKRVIFLFMSGGPSHVDTFDPKPRLLADMGKPLPFEKPKLERTKTGNLLGSP